MRDKATEQLDHPDVARDVAKRSVGTPYVGAPVMRFCTQHGGIPSCLAEQTNIDLIDFR